MGILVYHELYMYVVSVIAQKGGTGKTTLALSLAVAAHLAGRTVAIVDLDPQATATNWHDRRGEHAPFVISAQPARLSRVLQTANDEGADLVVIDTPPRAEQAALSAARAATLVLIPCRPAVFDLDTVSTTLDLLKLSGPTLPVAAVLNGVPAIGDERTQAATILRDLGLTVCPIALGLRKAYAQSAETGKSAQEFAPASKAADEIRAVYRFVNRLLKETV